MLFKNPVFFLYNVIELKNGIFVVNNLAYSVNFFLLKLDYFRHFLFNLFRYLFQF